MRLFSLFYRLVMGLLCSLLSLVYKVSYSSKKKKLLWKDLISFNRHFLSIIVGLPYMKDQFLLKFHF